MDLPPELLSLLGAMTLSVPLTVRALRAMAEASKKRASAKEIEAQAAKTDADAEKVIADAVRDAVSLFERRLQSAEEHQAKCDARVAALEHQSRCDTELIEKLSEKAERDESIIAGMRAEMADLRRSITAGGGSHA